MIENIDVKYAMINFYSNMNAKGGGLKIPLGVISELVTPKINILAILARTKLADEDMIHVGELGRLVLNNPGPFNYLEGKFYDAWNSDAPVGNRLDLLSQQNRFSLRFENPESVGMSVEIDTMTDNDIDLQHSLNLRKKSTHIVQPRASLAKTVELS